MVSIDYQPTNPLRGQGTVGTAPFRYQPSDEQSGAPASSRNVTRRRRPIYISPKKSASFSRTRSGWN